MADRKGELGAERGHTSLEMVDSRHGLAQLFDTGRHGVIAFEVVRDSAGGRDDYIWIYGNLAAERICGLVDSELRGKRFFEAYPAARMKWSEVFERVVRSGEPAVDWPLALAGAVVPARVVPYRDGLAAFIPDPAIDRMDAQRSWNELRFQRIWDSNLIGLFSTAGTEGILEANGTFLSMLGYGREDLEEGKLDTWASTPPEWRPRSEAAHREVVCRGSARPFEMEYFRKDGSRIPVLVGATQVSGRKQLVFVMDLTARKRAEQTLRCLSDATRILGERLDRPEAILERLAAFIAEKMASYCVIDLMGPDGFMTRVAAEHRDPTRHELVRKMVAFGPRNGADPSPFQPVEQGRSVLIESFDDAARAHLAQTPEHRALIDALEARSAIGVPMTVHGRTHGAILLFEAERRFDREDLDAAEELGRRAAVAVENALLYQDAQRAVRLRDEFLTVASHELKTPLTPLLLRLQQLQRLADAAPPLEPMRAQVQELADAAMGQVRKVASLVRDLLDVSRISEGRLRMIRKAVNLEELMRDVCRELSDEARQAGCVLDLRATGPVVGMWDRSQLEEVAANLLLNAFKYGSGRPVHLRVEGADGRARLIVRDEGIGIAPEHLERIFGKFERAVSGRHYGGLGLGLYIARQLVEAMGGEILVDSIPSQGAMFTVELPTGLPAGTAPSAEAEAPG